MGGILLLENSSTDGYLLEDGSGVLLKDFSLQDIKDRADAILAPIAADIQTRQDTWILTHENYWQGQRFFAAVPEDGEDEVPDLGAAPSGVEDTSWSIFGVTVPATVSCLLQVDNHNGPLGKGYTMIALVTFNGRLFRRSLGIGPYGQTQGWTELFPPPG